MARRFTRLGAPSVTTTFLGGCMMLPLHGAMTGMGGNGEATQAQGGDSPAHGEVSHSGPARGHGAGHEAHAAAVNPLLARCEYPLLLREPAQAVAREIRKRFAQAYARAQSAAVAALRSEPRPCS